jgi:hypothetical protein
VNCALPFFSADFDAGSAAETAKPLDISHNRLISAVVMRVWAVIALSISSLIVT